MAYESYRAEIFRLYEAGKSYVEIAKKFDFEGTEAQGIDRVRKVIQRAIKKGEIQRRSVDINSPSEPQAERGGTFEMRSDGTIISDRIIEIFEEEAKSPRALMIAHNLDPDLFEMMSYKSNLWHSQLKGGRKQVSGQSKITVKPAKQTVTLEHIDEYFKSRDFSVNKPLVPCYQYDDTGEILEIDLPDLHAGLLAWIMETGDNYDLHIVRSRFLWCASDIVYRLKGKKIKKIYVATLGDLLHVDNDSQTTTKGTFQQADGRITKIYDFTLDLLIEFITMLGDIAPVEVIYLPGNHDRVTGYMLLRSVQMAFRKDENIVFDTMPLPQKARLFGITLVGFTHGDMAAKNLTDWLQHKFKALYGKCTYAEVHSGHKHTLDTKEAKKDMIQEGEFGGIILRKLPTIASSSYWENHEGYLSVLKTMMCFLWNEETGLRDVWYSNIA